jgi:hypothetical protein
MEEYKMEKKTLNIKQGFKNVIYTSKNVLNLKSTIKNN